MTEAELKNAFREAASLEFAGFSENESDHVHEFSEGFGKRMARLVRAEGRPTWRLFHTRPKRLVIIAAVIFAVMLLAACAVPEVRESVGGFFLRIFSDHAEIKPPEGIRDTLCSEYLLSPVPEGFSACGKNKAGEAVTTVYRDGNGGVIMLRQSANPDGRCVVNSMNAEYKECSVAGRSVFVLQAENYTLCSWVEDGYCFSLYCSSAVDTEAIGMLIRSVQSADRAAD
ncbi:MAG: DUF4367 domain-containing protein [Clostridiales bacterium]|nr:DUF4367 domain-containing protein [Clostridiales bacterium]